VDTDVVAQAVLSTRFAPDRPVQRSPLAEDATVPTQVVSTLQTARTAVACRRRRRGFSLIEILIAIGVILILMGIGIYGYKSLEESGSRKQTMATLASAAGLLKEMNSTGSYSRIEGPANQTPEPFYQLGYSLNNPGDVNIGKAGRNTIANDNTAMNTPAQPRLMRILKQNPKIGSMIGSMPSSALLKPDLGQPARTEPILADAWENPLLFVPSGGLKDVTLESTGGTGGTKHVITSSGQAVSPANRAFWASAGPDGNFITGDDNLYSFQN